MTTYVSTRLVGGLRFVKVGRLCVSWCVSTKARPFEDGGIDAELVTIGFSVSAAAYAALAVAALRDAFAGNAASVPFAAFFLAGFLVSAIAALWLASHFTADPVTVQS